MGKGTLRDIWMRINGARIDAILEDNPELEKALTEMEIILDLYLKETNND